MMHKTLALLLTCLLAGGVVFAEPEKAEDDSAANAGALEVRATQAFSAGEYAKALPMLKKVAEMVKDDVDRVSIIEEQIRVCERNLARQAAENLKAKQSDPSKPANPEPPPTAESRKAHPKPKEGQVVDLTIKELGNFDYDQENGGNIPADVQALTGSTVRIRGFMIPMDQAESITRFAMVPDLFACCFGQPPQVQHTVVAECPPGKAVSYFPDEIVVEGKLKVEERKDDGFIVSIFELDVNSVKPAPR